MRTGITCNKIPLQKSIEFDIPLKQSATRYKQKQKDFLVPEQQLAESLTLVVGFYERTREGQN